MKRMFEAPKGKTIFDAGQDCPGFVVLSEGSIKVTLGGASGREVVLYRVRPGEVCLQTFTCLIDGTPYGAHGVAESDLKGELIPAAAFKARMAEDAAFRDRIMASVAARFTDYQQLIEDVALTDFDTRLARVLLRLSDGATTLAVTHSALAAETASGRAYVTRRLAKFAARGILEQTDKGLSLLDRRALEQIAAGER